MFVSEGFWDRSRRRTSFEKPEHLVRGGEELVATTLGTGHSAHGKPYMAGIEAARTATDRLGGRRPDLTFVFIAPGLDGKQVMKGVKQVVGECIAVGAEVTGTLFTEELVVEGGALVGAFSLPGVQFHAGIAKGFQRDPAATIAEMLAPIESAREQNSGAHASLLVIAPNSFPLVGETLYRELAPAVEGYDFVSGGVFGKPEGPDYVSFFWDEESGSDHLIGIGFFAKQPLSVALAQGFHPFCPLKATKVKGNLLTELDGQPVQWALREIFERRNVSVDVLRDPQKGPDILSRFVLAVADRGKPGVFRSVLPLALERSGIRTGGMIPEGSTVWLSSATEEGMVLAAGESSRAAVRDLGGATPGGALIFESILRLYIMGDKYREEKEALRKNLGAPFLGVNTVEELIIAQNAYSQAHAGSMLVSLFGVQEESPDA